MFNRLIQTLCFIVMLLSTTVAISGPYQGYNHTQHPSIYFGGDEYRPYTPGFQEDLMSGDDTAYDKAFNNEYDWAPGTNSSSYYNPIGLPRVVWVSPYTKSGY